MPAARERALQIEFVLDETGPTYPSDFVDFVAYADGLVRSYVEAELLSLADDLGLEAYKVGIVMEARRLLRVIPPPADVRDVRHQSPWLLVLAIPSALLLPFIHRCLNPVIREAWNDSDLKDRLFSFMRDRVFRGAKKQLENQAALVPRKRNVAVRDVNEEPSGREGPIVKVRLRRTEILEVSTSDERLLAEFRERLRRE